MTWLVGQGSGKYRVGKPEKNDLETNHTSGFVKVATKYANLCIAPSCPPETSSSNTQEMHSNQKEGAVKSNPSRPQPSIHEVLQKACNWSMSAAVIGKE